MSHPLLSGEDPAPAEVVEGAGPLVITVEHGGHAVPAALGGLGLPEGAIRDHIGWDPGAAAVARVLRARLDATLVVQPYSRLVIDCNRPRGAPDLCAPASDGVAVPANAGLTEADRQARWEAIHAPFHAAVAAALDARPAPALIALHSYTPRRRADAAPRPWPVGLLWRQDNPLARHLAARLAALPEAQPLGLNAPYAIEDASDFTIPAHAEPRRLPHVLVELRNDLIATQEAATSWAERLAEVCSEWRKP
jgi:predicted N-formylglutamate amidohydrolase